ncbi:MAG: non-ribosomal peptide synthetase, partial [Cohnella sp.]|nr:non-ribosomal peptide synthetase [Cohnella sp.]
AAGLEVKHVIPVRNVPRTTSGKLQRYKLAQSYERGEFTDVIHQIEKLLDERHNAPPLEMPVSQIEQQLALIWTSALGISTIGIHDDFFEVGGDSLKAAFVMNEIHKQFHIEIPAAVIYESSTIKKLADYMQEANKSQYSPIAPAEQRQYYPLSSAQYRVYVQEQFDGIGTTYNMPVVIHLEGDLDLSQIEYALRSLISHHECLRTCFVEVEGSIMQEIKQADQIDFSLKRIVVDGTNYRSAIDDFIRPFRLSDAPLFRAGIVSGKDLRKSYLVLDMHHAISDGISISHLIEQFSLLYQGNKLPMPELQFKDYVMWEHERRNDAARQQHRAYWQRQLEGELPLLDMPTDFKRSDNR